ncbi:MAG: hypothetical protein ACYC4Q_06915 [Victivallaceae bacterium]
MPKTAPQKSRPPKTASPYSRQPSDSRLDEKNHHHFGLFGNTIIFILKQDGLEVIPDFICPLRIAILIIILYSQEDFMKEPDFNDEEKLTVTKNCLQKYDKKELLWPYLIYLLPSLLFIALSLKTEDFELCLLGYITLLGSFLYILYYGLKAQRLESGIIKKYAECFKENKEEQTKMNES